MTAGAKERATTSSGTRPLSLPVVEAVRDLQAALRDLDTCERASRAAITPARAEEANRRARRAARAVTLSREALDSLLRDFA